VNGDVEAFVLADAEARRRAMQRGSVAAFVADGLVHRRAAGKPDHITDESVYRLLDGLMFERTGRPGGRDRGPA
jgi:hypothetical protein